MINSLYLQSIKTQQVMNKKGRERAKGIAKRLDKAFQSDDIEYIKEAVESEKQEIEELRDEEDEKLSNMSDNLQGTERYNDIESARDSLQDAYDSLDDIDFETSTLDEIKEQIDLAIGFIEDVSL